MEDIAIKTGKADVSVRTYSPLKRTNPKNTCLEFRNYKRTGEMAQSLKYLPHKPKDLSLSLRIALVAIM